jgi:hypothetical protein
VTRLATSLLALGLTVGGAAAGHLYATRTTRDDLSREFFRASASNVRLNALVLTQLRSGDSAKAQGMLEDLLAINLVSLSFYERDVPLDRRDADIYAAVERARAYYEQFPDAKVSEFAKPALELRGSAL